MTEDINPLRSDRRREFGRRWREENLIALGAKPDEVINPESELARAERLGREFIAEQCAQLSPEALRAIAPELSPHPDLSSAGVRGA